MKLKMCKPDSQQDTFCWESILKLKEKRTFQINNKSRLRGGMQWLS